MRFVRVFSSRSSMHCPPMSAAMEEWFRPCRKACCCPRHNPPVVEEKQCVPTQPRTRWDQRCVFVKHPCARNHGAHCTCHACEACRADGDFLCHLEQCHGACCDCMFCAEPHDYGCECAECARAGVVFDVPARPPPRGCNIDGEMADVRRKNEDAALKRRVMALGEDCYCLLHHPTDCACACCKLCKERLARDRKRARMVAKRQRKLMEMIAEREAAHGTRCACVKCAATRLRVEVTMCFEHLAMCKCQNELGKGCRCKTCAACIRRLRKARIPKAEDTW